ncbi:hypothetical protein B5F74_02295 [Collinsella sp. An271]|uniref:hypothetical protein n=1 Tax=Collinsella sp. An271 TaxID=1965616 RepID=UPI000B398BBE|nr:hypothetical protein [Collinsella sp. An271]OUO62062.1 hypothetical protein B5F74_02295 [Collinsella sp. An271]
MAAAHASAGIPREPERAPIRVDTLHRMRPGRMPEVRPIQVRWPDGRAWRVERIVARDEYTMPGAGGLVVRWRVILAGQLKTLYQQGDTWFVRARKQTGGDRT